MATYLRCHGDTSRAVPKMSQSQDVACTFFYLWVKLRQRELILVRANLTRVTSPPNPTTGGSILIFSITFSYFLFSFYLPWSTLPDFPSVTSLASMPFLSSCHHNNKTRFVAEHHLSLPPGSGIESIAMVSCFLR